MEKLNVLRTALAVSITLIVLNLVCAVAVSISSTAVIDYANSWMHGIDFTLIKSNKPTTVGAVAYGTISIGLLGLAVGAVYAAVFNLLRGVGGGARRG